MSENWGAGLMIKPERFEVTGPDDEGDFEFLIYGVRPKYDTYVYLNREQANELIRVLQRGLTIE